MDFAQFEQLGFTSNETRVYLFLAERGRLPAQMIAKSCRMPRSTVYSVLDSLESRGLLRREKIKGATVFRLRDPEAIIDWLEDDAKKNRIRQAAAKRVISDLRQFFRSAPAYVPKLEFVEGKTKVAKFLDENLLRWADSIMQTDRSTWGYQDHTFVEMFQPWIQKAWKTLHEERGVAGRILSNRSEVESKLKGKIANREVRFLGNEFNFESSTWIMGEYVIVIMSRKAPIYAFQLHDGLLANNLRLVFRHLYNQAQSKS